MKDKIDEKNFKEKVASTIIKRYNVKMVLGEEGNKREIGKKEEIKPVMKYPVKEENHLLQQESLPQENLEAIESVDNNQVTNQQLEELFKEENYNVKTNSYSGEYGKGSVSEESRLALERIESEKEEKLKRAVEEGRENF